VASVSWDSFKTGFALWLDSVGRKTPLHVFIRLDREGDYSSQWVEISGEPDHVLRALERLPTLVEPSERPPTDS
jgi:hypothetical protein